MAGEARRMLRALVGVALSVSVALTGTGTTALADDCALGAQAHMPRRFDLRERGVVTPVKSQNPFSTCWAFGSIAAAETSILSDAGTTYDATGFDLSERHLAWFAVHPIGEVDDRSQEGEGIHVNVGEAQTETDATYNFGGIPLYVTTLFASGMGPILEEYFPYQGNTGLLESDYYTQHYDELIEELAEGYLEEDPDLDEASAATKAKETLENRIASVKASNYYAEEDDWTIPAVRGKQPTRLEFSGYTLRDGNILPEASRRGEPTDDAPDGIWLGKSDEGERAMKQELLNGRAISVGFCADTSTPGQDADGLYLNLDNWAHYTFEDAPTNHEVCVVGWDDDYPAANFTHKVIATDEDGEYVFDEDGNPVYDEERSRMTTPPEDGAWLVKNSWGSETDSVKDSLVDADGDLYDKNGLAWGYTNEQGLHTGYFWISYYDKTLSTPETFDFDTDFAAGPFYAQQYDYMPAMCGFWELSSYDNLTSANVFAAETDSALKSISTRTFEENTRVTFRVYRLREGAANPQDGELVASLSHNFEYAGFHRVNLSVPVPFKLGERFSVVACANAVDDAGKRVYGVQAAAAFPKESMEAMGFDDGYGVAVVNPGESYLEIGPNWVDWADYQKTEEFRQSATIQYGEDELLACVDNFAIKAYLVPRK